MSRTFKRLTVTEAANLILNPDVRVYDVREAPFYVQAHIEGAQHMNGSTQDDVIIDTPKNTTILFYCHHGNASQVYAQTFADFGFKNVYDLIDGYEAWRVFETQRKSAQNAGSPSAALRAWLDEEGFAADDINSLITNKTTPLMHAARHGQHEIVAELIALGANLDARNADGNNALWLACFNNDAETIGLLLKAGVSVNNLNDNGATCLMYAASSSKPKVVAQLLAAGAGPQLKSLDDFTALDMCADLESLQLLRTATRK